MSIYDDVAALQTRVTALEGSQITDSGWIDLPLATGIEAYGTGNNAPQYRKIGNEIFLHGGVKNITVAGIIGTLPEGYRPTNGHVFVQNTSHENNIAKFVRWGISANGNITLYYTDASDISAGDWFPINTSFLID